MQNMIENLINGNLKEAREQAKAKSLHKIAQFCRLGLNWSPTKSYYAAHYLKTGEGFQAYCDAT